jgi:alkylhydroperoxidase family enzyme
VIVKELRNLGKMRVFHRLDIFTQLLQSECGLRFAVRMVKDMHQLPDNTAEAVHKTVVSLNCCLHCCVLPFLTPM